MNKLSLVVSLLAGVLALGGAVCAQGELDYTPRLPRPVDAEAREMLGYAPPREVGVVLAEFDALVEPKVPDASPNDPEDERIVIFSAWRNAKYEYHLARVNLISELEEAGYDGERLDELLEAKFISAARLRQTHEGTISWIKGQLWEMEDMYPDRPIANRARAMRMTNALRGLLPLGFRVDESVLQSIADIELKESFGEERAGSLLMRAIGAWRGDEDSDVYEHWSQWIVDNLPSESSAVKQIMMERRLNTPLRVQGVGLDGETIDTADWMGSVVLVDCWGLWCGPCLAQMPEVKAIYEKYRGRGLIVVGVLADWRPEEARQYLANHGYDWPQIVDAQVKEMKDIDSHAVIDQLNVEVSGYPTIHLIDRDGIQRTMYGVADLEKEVLQWLDTPATGDE